MKRIKRKKYLMGFYLQSLPFLPRVRTQKRWIKSTLLGTKTKEISQLRQRIPP